MAGMESVVTLARSTLRALVLFVLGYLPLVGIVGVIEGAALGRWGLSAHDWQYQLAAYAVLVFPWLALSGIMAIPLTLGLLHSGRWLSPVPRRLWSAISGPLAIAPSAAIVCAVAGGLWTLPFLMLWKMPFAFLGGSAAFSLSCARYAAPPAQPREDAGALEE